MTDLLLVTAAAIGLARITRVLPLRAAIQARLERSWTGGKPLNCWTCLVFWCALLVVVLAGKSGIVDNALVVLGSTGVGASLLTWLDPITPEFLPPVEVDNGEK